MPKYYDKTELMKRVKLLKKGMSVEQCIAIIGAPTNRRNEFAKEKNVLLGISLYFVVHQNGSRLDPSIDCYLQASFDRVGNLIALSEFNMK